MKTGLEQKSFLLGALAGALLAFTLWMAVTTLIFPKRVHNTSAEPPNIVLTSLVDPAPPDTPKYPVEGTWFNERNPRNPCSIVSTANELFVTDESGASSLLEYDPAGIVIATDWRRGLRGLRGELQGDTIRWANGAVWVRQPEKSKP